MPYCGALCDLNFVVVCPAAGRFVTNLAALATQRRVVLTRFVGACLRWSAKFCRKQIFAENRFCREQYLPRTNFAENKFLPRKNFVAQNLEGMSCLTQRRSRKTVALLLPPSRKSYDSVYSSVTQSNRAVIVRSDLICQLAPRNTRNNYTSLFLVVLVLCCFP